MGLSFPIFKMGDDAKRVPALPSQGFFMMSPPKNRIVNTIT